MLDSLEEVGGAGGQPSLEHNQVSDDCFHSEVEQKQGTVPWNQWHT